MMIAHNVVEPTVIDDELLAKAVNEQASGDAAEIARKEGIDLHEVTCLRLDYKNILKIDNLWQFDSLTKLQLDNNIIEKIEGIGHLKNLKWLDLSFNNIAVIEGLDGLTQLTDLSLFNNRIAKLQNMDHLVHLNVLSIGNNDIQDMTALAYLSRFDNLRLLNVAGNPLCKNQDYKSFLLSRLKALKYLDYRLVEPAAITAAREKYIDDIIAIEEEQKITTKADLERAALADQAAQLRSAFLPGINTLFETMFSTDTDYARLLPLAPGVLGDLQATFATAFATTVTDLTAQAHAHRALRAQELAEFHDSVASTTRATDAVAAQIVADFMHDRKARLRAVAAAKTPRDADEAVASVKSRIQQAADELMALELNQVEQFEDLVKELERNYTDLAGGIKEVGTTAFAKLRELENEFQEKVGEAVMAAFERQAKADLEEVEDAVRDLLRDKDAVANHLTGSHDHRLGKIDAQEEAFSSGLAKDVDSKMAAVHQNETTRSRSRLREIIMFAERCHQEIELADESGQ
ncbi:Dynein regulatory complex subunit 3 [Allomyces arbusculus]|nr:Dynein regulatory complex subunit 3 [Allomyces arbusculus]